MLRNVRNRERRFSILVAMMVLIVLIPPREAPAVVTEWIGVGDGLWSVSANWLRDGSVNQVPQPMDDVAIRNGYSTYDYTFDPLASLTIDSYTIDTYGTLVILGSYDLTIINSALIGNSGNGTFTQVGGGNTVIPQLYLGFESTGTGVYNLGAGNLSANNAFIGYGGTGSFSQMGGTNDIGEINLGNNSSGNGSYYLGGGTLTAGYEYVARNGTGTFIQAGGTNSITSGLYLAAFASSTGTYTLYGGTLSAPSETVGSDGTGIFTQYGGTNALTDYLYVGYGYVAGSSGTYNLGGDGVLTAYGELIGYTGTGTFTQSGGTNTIASALVVGSQPGSNGKYNLNYGDLTATNGIVVGESGTGTFNQNGGTSNTAQLTVGGGLTSNGTYNLNNGSLSSQNAHIGNAGPGTFHQTGGTHTVTNTLALGNPAGGIGTYILSNYAQLYAGAENIGYNGGTGTFHQNGGNNIAGQLDIGGQGVYILTGGTLFVGASGMRNEGVFTMAGGTLFGDGSLQNNGLMSGYGTISGTGGFMNNALFTQGAGTLTISSFGTTENFGTMELASGRQVVINSTLGNSGSLNLNGATVSGYGTLSNHTGGVIAGRGTINSQFYNSGLLLVESGTTRVSNDFFNEGNIQLAGLTANLSGGGIINLRTIQGYGNVGNQVYNFGIVEALGGTLNLNGPVANIAGGLITAGTGNKVLVTGSMPTNEGVVNLTGGTFDTNNRSLVNSGQISGYGTFRTGGLSNSGTMTLTGGTTTVNGGVTNQAGGKVEVAHNPGIFTGNVLNDAGGVFKVTQTNVTFAGTFTNNGGYISDPATTQAPDIVIGSTGYLIGGVGDQWILSNDFVNQSAQNALWSTGAAYLGFVNGADTLHDLYIPGVDLGVGATGYANNFAWGTLSIGANNDLVLRDGNGISGGALYVGQILGLELSGLTVGNITGNGFNIYYNPALNGALGGLTYALANGGSLIAAAPVPIPGSLILFGSGLLGLIGIGRRRARKSYREVPE